MSALADLPAERVIEAIEGLLFAAEEQMSWDLVRAARRMLVALLPDEPDPITMKIEPSPALKTLRDALRDEPPSEPPPRPPKSPRRSPKPQGQPTGSGTSRYQLLRDELARRKAPASVAELAEAIGHPRKKVGISLANMATSGDVRRTGPGMYASA